MTEKGARVVVSPEMLAVARQAAQHEGLPIDFRLSSLDDGLPFEAHQFDLVICALMLSHVPDLPHALQMPVTAQQAVKQRAVVQSCQRCRLSSRNVDSV